MREHARYSPTRRRVLQTGIVATGLGIAGCLGNSGNTLQYLGRGGVTQEAFRNVISDWEDENDVTVQHTSVADDTEMVNVVSENPGGIDLCNPSSGGFIRFRGQDEKLLADLDYGEIPNYDNLPEAWHNVPFLEGHDDGLFRYISSQGLAYNTELVDEFSSWDEIERSEYADLISLHATPSSRFANAAAAAGEDINQIGDDAVFDAIVDKVDVQHQNVFQYWTSGDQQMQFLREEQAHISSAWGGRVASLQADDVPIDYFIPEEGAVTHSEGYAIPEASENKETVYDLLNWVYQRENLVDLSVQIDYPVPISDPPEEVTSLPDYTDHPDNLVWVDWSQVLPHNDKISQAFNEVRGS